MKPISTGLKLIKHFLSPKGGPYGRLHVPSLTRLPFSDLTQGLHGPPGDKGNRVSQSPRTLDLVTNVFMMGWHDQLETPDLTGQIVFPYKSP